MQLSLSGALCVCLLLLGESAHAGIFTVNQTLDVTQPMAASPFLGWQGLPAFTGGVNIPLGVGDTLDYTVDFLNDQSLTVTNMTLAWAYIYADTSSEVKGTGSFQFLDAAGLPFLSSLPLTDTEGDAHFGQIFGSGNFAGGWPASLTFYGVRYVGTIEAYIDPNTTSRNYNEPAFYMLADNVAINAVAVPEPSTMSILGLGFSLAGLYSRRNRREKSKHEAGQLT